MMTRQMKKDGKQKFPSIHLINTMYNIPSPAPSPPPSTSHATSSMSSKPFQMGSNSFYQFFSKENKKNKLNVNNSQTLSSPTNNHNNNSNQFDSSNHPDNKHKVVSMSQDISVPRKQHPGKEQAYSVHGVSTIGYFNQKKNKSNQQNSSKPKAATTSAVNADDESTHLMSSDSLYGYSTESSPMMLKGKFSKRNLNLQLLNEDILDEILTYLPARTLAAISCVSKTIQQSVKTRVTRALNLNYIERILRPVYSKSVFVNDLHFLSYVENGFCNPAISCGFEHTAFVSKHGNVFTWGSGNDGKLGHGDFESKTTPTKVDGLKNIISVSCGHSHTNALTKNGKVYCFGEGQLKPVLIEGAMKNKFVTKVSSGNNMSVFVTKDNEIYISGPGLILHEEQQTPTVSTFVSSDPNLDTENTETLNIFSPRKIQLGEVNVDNNTAIVQIATGARHLLILNSKGEVFSCGFGGAGQLGHDDLSDKFVPKRITGLNKPVVFISAGQFHSVAVTSTGELFTFGLSSSGRLGHRRVPANRERRNELPVVAIPLRVELPSKVVMAAAGYSHTLVLTADNNVLSFGDSSFGQLGNGSQFFVASDNISNFAVTLPKNDRFTQVCAGGEHSCVLTEQGDIFVAGNGALLGLGDSMRQTFRVSRPRMMSIIDEDPGTWKSRKDVGFFASFYSSVASRLTNSSSSKRSLLSGKFLGNLKLKVTMKPKKIKRSQSFS